MKRLISSPPRYELVHNLQSDPARQCLPGSLRHPLGNVYRSSRPLKCRRSQLRPSSVVDRFHVREPTESLLVLPDPSCYRSLAARLRLQDLLEQ